MNKIIETLLATNIENVNPEFVAYAETRASFLPHSVDVDERMVAIWVSDWRATNPELPIINWQAFEDEAKERNRQYQIEQRAAARAARQANREAIRNEINAKKEALDQELAKVQEQHAKLQAQLDAALENLDDEAMRDANEDAEDRKG